MNDEISPPEQITITDISPIEVREETATRTSEWAAIQELETNRKLRKALAIGLLVLLLITNLAVLGIFYFQGLGRFTHPFSDGILVALITDTLAQIAGMVIIVVTYLFPSKQKK
jgi:hypothetical protein